MGFCPRHEPPQRAPGEGDIGIGEEQVARRLGQILRMFCSLFHGPDFSCPPFRQGAAGQHRQVPMSPGTSDRLGNCYRFVCALIVDQDHIEGAGIVEIEKTAETPGDQGRFVARGDNGHDGRPGLGFMQRFGILAYRGAPKVATSGDEVEPDREACCRYGEVRSQLRSSARASTE